MRLDSFMFHDLNIFSLLISVSDNWTTVSTCHLISVLISIVWASSSGGVGHEAPAGSHLVLDCKSCGQRFFCTNHAYGKMGIRKI